MGEIVKIKALKAIKCNDFSKKSEWGGHSIGVGENSIFSFILEIVFYGRELRDPSL